jgi:hypothetical protein
MDNKILYTAKFTHHDLKLNVSMMMALTYIVLGCDQIKKEKLFNFGIHMVFAKLLQEMYFNNCF